MIRSVSVVLPCLNEVESVAEVVEEAWVALRLSNVTGEVIVVDNGSTDGSAESAQRAGAEVILERKRGYGQAYITGFRAASGDVILMADADASYDLSALPAFLAKIDEGYDLVMGSRLKGRIDPGAMPWLHRHVGTPAISIMLNLLYGTGVSDSQCGIRAFRRSILSRLDLTTPGMEFASEMIVNAARARLRIAEVPADYRVRVGRSKLNTLRDGWRHLRFLMTARRTRLP